MFGKKKNYEKYYKKDCGLLDKHLNDIDNYDYFNNLYNKIKADYERKIENNEIDISVERVRLESKAGKSISNSMTIYISFAVVALSTLVNGFIQAYSVSEYKNKVSLIIEISVAFYFAILFFSAIYVSKDGQKDFIYNICLTVINDIEKEMEDEKKSELQRMDNKKVQELIAATLEVKESNKESFINKIFRKFNS